MHREIWKVTTSITCPSFWGPHIPSPLIKKEIPSRTGVWFHPWECVGRLGLGLNKMNSSALSPLPFGSSHALTFLWRNGVILEYFGKKELPHFPAEGKLWPGWSSVVTDFWGDTRPLLKIRPHVPRSAHETSVWWTNLTWVLIDGACKPILF